MDEMLSWSVVSEIVSLTWAQTLQEVFETFTWRNNIRIILGGAFCFFWIVAMIWVIKDSNARSDNLGFQFISILFILVLTPVFGLPLYIACRPQGRKWDKRPWRQALLTQLQACKNCHHLTSTDHDCCTHCGHILKVECRECHEFYANDYEYCPRCGAPHLDE
jgi:RNA polymerase subunit RPABC4/transcription elongation factor Spt4